MSKTLPTSPIELLTCFESILDELIQDEREEQDAILKRETASLPMICGRIDQRTMELNRVQRILAEFWPKPNPPTEMVEPGKRTLNKLKNLQQLTIQNHLLLEHHLTFLREIHREVLGISHKPFLLYDDTGMMSGEWTESGALLNAKV